MHDDASEMEGNGLMAQALLYLDQTVSQPYWPANDDAMEFQNKHHRITFVALLTGTIAVVIAILQLAITQLHTIYMANSGSTDPMAGGEVWRWGLAIFEFCCAGVAGFYVIRGVRLAIQKKWLLERHKAERLRFLKYNALLSLTADPEASRGLKNWKQRVKREAETIGNMDEDEMERWWKENRRMTKDPEELKLTITEDELNQLMEYYKQKRLDKQMKYFFRKSERNLASDSFWKLLPPSFFVASILCAVSHLLLSGALLGVHHIWKSVPRDPVWEKVVSTILITMAALFPVLGAGIRTHRSANEFSRNTVRFHAVYLELMGAYDRLVSSATTKDKLEDLWRSEETLENEHREWLRLMDEAEWYG